MKRIGTREIIIIVLIIAIIGVIFAIGIVGFTKMNDKLLINQKEIYNEEEQKKSNEINK